jgi:hypothetical protein
MILRPRRSLLLALLLVSVAIRLVPYLLARAGVSIDPASTVYPWNFSPLLAASLFGGACLADRRLAFLLPVGAYLLGDLGIWLVTGRLDWAFYSYQPIVYLSVALVVASGFLARSRRTAGRVAGAGLLSAIAFFLITNAGVWIGGGGVRYPLTAAGLLDCYVQAIPFFRNSLISMAVLLPVLFSRVGLTPVAATRRLAVPLGGPRVAVGNRS